jgi:coenzyme F420-0:L-glutamate ligase/coenzyme F420-1:gamma-L-glutamate ligase
VSAQLEVRGVDGLPEVAAGDDLAMLLVGAGADLRDGDVVVVTSKVVSKAEGRLVAGSREDHLDAESVRLVASRGQTRIVETRHGLVLAAAGIDASNVPPGMVALLPVDPDASARRLRAGLAASLDVDVAVVVSDTMGRPWRDGVVDTAIGAAGLDVLWDLRGQRDRQGNLLEATVVAIADELAAAADLVKGKLSATPVAVIRGFPFTRGDVDAGSAPLVRRSSDDMFRLGTREARRSLVLDAVPVAAVTGDIDEAAVRRAVAAVDAPVEVSDGGRTLVVRGDALHAGVTVGRLLAALAAEDLRAVWPVTPPAGTPGPATALRVGRVTPSTEAPAPR